MHRIVAFGVTRGAIFENEKRGGRGPALLLEHSKSPFASTSVGSTVRSSNVLAVRVGQRLILYQLNFFAALRFPSISPRIGSLLTEFHWTTR